MMRDWSYINQDDKNMFNVWENRLFIFKIKVRSLSIFNKTFVLNFNHYSWDIQTLHLPHLPSPRLDSVMIL